MTDDADLTPEERALAERLRAERPVPAVETRRQGRNRLVAMGAARVATRPAHPAAVAAALALAGLLLLAVALLGVAGSGPLAA